jgi:hypothetical protein
MAMVTVWEYEKSKGLWAAMKPGFGEALTHYLSVGHAGITWSENYGPQAPEGEWQWNLTGWVPYAIDFQAMTQTNQQNNVVRRVRCVHIIRGGT